MIPLALSPDRLQLGLAGSGPAGLRRLRALHEAGATRLRIYTEDNTTLATEAGPALRPALPDEAELSQLHVLWIAGLPRGQFVPLAEAARRLRVLVNVEDEPEFCDFHAVAEIRRGDLLLTVSTGGAAPGLAGAIRRRLEDWFPAAWADRVKEVAALRQSWRAEHVPVAEAARRIGQLADERCWLSSPEGN